jgi:hypothetical protein
MLGSLGFLMVCALFAMSGCVNLGLTKADDAAQVALKSKCREDGDRVRSEWIKTYFGNTFSNEPEYTYNESLKTCLWLDQYWGPSLERSASAVSKDKSVAVVANTRFILDVYTNKTVIEYIVSV